MTEGMHPGPEDQGVTRPDLGATEGGDPGSPEAPSNGEAEEAEQDAGRTPAEKLQTFETLMALGDLRDMEGKLEWWNTIIEGDGYEGEDSLQSPLDESRFSPEVVAAIKSQREIWRQAAEATRHNVETIRAALREHQK